MSGAIPPIPQYAIMAWGSVKAQGEFYLFTFTFKFLITEWYETRRCFIAIIFQICARKRHQEGPRKSVKYWN
jgi:hypothetical protein